MRMITNNPLVDFGLKVHGHLFGRWTTAGTKKPEIEEVVMFRCCACGDLHEDESDAEDCCTPVNAEVGVYCPVCANNKLRTYSEAVDCCLWKALPISKRLSVVDEMEAGKTWAEAIGQTEIRKEM